MATVRRRFIIGGTQNTILGKSLLNGLFQFVNHAMRDNINDKLKTRTHNNKFFEIPADE